MSSTIHRRGHNARPQNHEDEHSNVRRKLAYKIIGAEDDEPSCFGNAWKSVASLLLTAMLLGPLLYTSYQKMISSSRGERDSIPDFLLQADEQHCASKLNISYSQLFLDVKLSNIELCRTTLRTTDCACRNPMIPHPRSKREGWFEAFQRNQDLVHEATSTVDASLDVVLTGDSITEHWLGTTVAQPTPYVDEKMELWHDLSFDTHALALGISGDRTPHLLYRMQNGELPDDLIAKAWWILIGTNDYGLDECCKEAVLAGNLAILAEGLNRRPDSHFIINSLFPKGDDTLTMSSTWKDYTWINERLDCLAELDGLTFFNGTLLFLTDDETQVNQTLLYDFLHPSTEGYRRWGKAIQDTLRQLGIWSD